MGTKELRSSVPKPIAPDELDVSNESNSFNVSDECDWLRNL